MPVYILMKNTISNKKCLSTYLRQTLSTISNVNQHTHVKRNP